MKAKWYFFFGALFVLVSACCVSCDESKEPTLPVEDDFDPKVQIYYMSLVDKDSANNIKYITINDVEYSYEHETMLPTYNYAPSYTLGCFYNVKEGKCRVKLETETGNETDGYVRTTVFDGTTSVSLQKNEKYQLVLWGSGNGSNINVHYFPKKPTKNESGVYHTEGRLFNYLYDAPGVPTKAKLYFDVKLQNQGEVIASYPEGGLAFGESSETFVVEYNKSRVHCNDYMLYNDLRAVYPDGTEIVLFKNDYWIIGDGSDIVSSDFFVMGDIEGVVRKWNMKRFRMW